MAAGQLNPKAMMLHYGLEIATLGDYADPRNVLRLAIAAETSGWEGLFIWDHLAFPLGVPSANPWGVLPAVAASTNQLKIGTAVTPAPNVSPQVLAQALAALDILSQGRVVFGAGLGGLSQEYAAFSYTTHLSERATMLDEGLELLKRLWAGEKVTQHSGFYVVDGIILSPTTLQRPCPPIWIGGENLPALQRAAHWNGWIVNATDLQGHLTKKPADMARKLATIHQYRGETSSFDVALTGYSASDQGALTREFAAVGVTWWLERLHGLRGSVEDNLQRVLAGPPHI